MSQKERSQVRSDEISLKSSNKDVQFEIILQFTFESSKVVVQMIIKLSAPCTEISGGKILFVLAVRVFYLNMQIAAVQKLIQIVSSSFCPISVIPSDFLAIPFKKYAKSSFNPVAGSERKEDVG